ncbi:hypothetical protein RVM26_14485 [Halomonas sp. KM072]
MRVLYPQATPAQFTGFALNTIRLAHCVTVSRKPWHAFFWCVLKALRFFMCFFGAKGDWFPWWEGLPAKSLCRDKGYDRGYGKGYGGAFTILAHSLHS